MAQPQDIGPIYRGEDVTLNFTMTPLTDITGWTTSFRVKAQLSDASVLLGPISATITVAAAGTFAVPLTAAQTSTLAVGTYDYDVWRTDSGSAAALDLGKVTVKGTVKTP